MKRGVFITFEGPDGSGKSTQVKLLAEYCNAHGYNVLLTREPGGTPISENIRNLILDPKNKEMVSSTEALLYAASRAQLVAQVIKPALESGQIVICDRFLDSSIAYQGYARGLGDDVRVINEFAIQGLQPDMTFFMNLDPEIGMSRVERGGYKDRLEQEAMDFHRKVYEGYLEVSKIYKDRYINIDASKSAADINAEISAIFEKYVAERS